MGRAGDSAVLEMFGIWKRFGSVDAIRGADFVLRPGEIHGLLGENGAGKSTLMHIAFGLVHADAGAVRVRGRQVRFRSPHAAMAAGLGMVHQHFTSIATMTVAENLQLALGPDRRATRRRRPPTWAVSTDRLCSALLEGIDRAAEVETLGVEQKQRLEVAQALSADASILLLDEPTAVLAPAQVASLFKLLRDFANQGGAVVLITHKLDEIRTATDRVTVLRRGEVALTGETAAVPGTELTRAMIGETAPPRLDSSSPPILEDDVPGEPGGDVRMEAPGLVVRAREIVGVAAVEGNGQRRLLRSLAGLERRSGASAREPVAFIAEDRSTEGLIPAFSLTENLVLGLPADRRWSEGPWILWRRAAARMAELIDEFEIRAPGPAVPARTLSGGNQQKLVFARAFEAAPRSVIAENPTRGLDIKSTAFVHGKLRELAAGGAGVLVYSTDLDEVLEMATRVVVMYRGALADVPIGATRDQIGAMMLGLEP